MDELPFHTRDPYTSREAARSAAGGAQAHRDRILVWLYHRGEYGGTAFEAWKETGGARPTGAGTRFTELEGTNAGKKRVTVPLMRRTDRSRLTDTNSPAQVWALTPAGVEHVRHLLRGAA